MSGERLLHPSFDMPLIDDFKLLATVERNMEMHCRYEIYAISRPATLLALASYPLTRYYQRRFRQESIAALRDAVETS